MLQPIATGASPTLAWTREMAIGDFDVAIRLAPEYTIAYYARGVSRRDPGQLEEAIKDVDEAVRLTREKALLLRGRAYVYLLLRQDQEVIDDYDDWNVSLRPS